MSSKKNTIVQKMKGVFVSFLVFIGLLSGVSGPILQTADVYAEPTTENVVLDEPVNNDTNTTSNTADSGSGSNDSVNVDACKVSLGALGWVVCPLVNKISEAVDWLYDKIEGVLLINPIEAKDGTPIYEIWKYCLGVTNVVFIIFLLVVIYSQITGWGINNYGIKKVLPKLIIMAIMVNLSFLICALAVDVSNTIGNGLRNLFQSVELAVAGDNLANTSSLAPSMAEMYTSMAGGTALAIMAGATSIMFEPGAIWMLIPTALGAIVAVATGLITIAMRQAVVVLLIMIAPLAFVANVLPNTESLFQKWKKLLTRMLVFYPMFSLLFGASQLAGFALIASAKDGFMLFLGFAVQVFPLFFSWKLMQMSGTFLGEINSRLRTLAAGPLAKNRTWAESRRQQTNLERMVNGKTPMSHLRRYMDNKRTLREKNIENLQQIRNSEANIYTQRRIADSRIGDTTSRSRRTSRYTQNAKAAHNYSLMSQNAEAHTEHVMNNYGNFFNNSAKDRRLNEQSQRAFLDYGRSVYLKEIDDENDVGFLVDNYWTANKRDENGNPVDRVAFERYVESVGGPDGQQRVMSKVVAQAAKTESKRRAEYAIMYAKLGHNGDNKGEFRDFITGYKIDDDGWALDEHGKRLKNADGTYLETVRGDAIFKAPERLVLYDKRDDQGLYYDMKDQEGNVIARIHRGVGADNASHDDAAFIKETFAKNDIPIGDPINDIYSMLAGVKEGSIITPQGENSIGLSKYSTTIGRALADYKGNAAWAGAMFNMGVSNRQIKNSAQLAIWVCDSIKKTAKPGALNVQNPASMEYLTTMLNPDNWDKIFTEEMIRDSVNINNEPNGGEDWVLNENGEIVDHIAVDDPTYEQRMNLIKRKYLFPAMKKILPAFDRLRTSNTVDNQKPGTADAQYEFLKMVEEKWENNDEINFDPTLVDQDLQSEAREFRRRKHDKYGNLIYSGSGVTPDQAENLLNQLEEIYSTSILPEDLKEGIFRLLSSEGRFSRALERFDELCTENPDATMEEINSWFVELDAMSDD